MIADATRQWSTRVLRISSLCGIFFGTLWLVNAAHMVSTTGAAAIGAAGAAAFVASVRVTRGTAPRPTGPGAAELEHRITTAGIVQAIAGVVLPVTLLATGHGEHSMAVVVASVGLLFLWLDRDVDVARLRAVGWALVTVPIATTMLLAGSARVATLLAVAGAAMVGNGLLGVRELRGGRAERTTRAMGAS